MSNLVWHESKSRNSVWVKAEDGHLLIVFHTRRRGYGFFVKKDDETVAENTWFFQTEEEACDAAETALEELR